MAKQKHIPQRTCIICRETKNKRELIRVVRTPEGAVFVDKTGKANGRGAYVCRQSSCYEQGLKKERLAQALNVKLSPDEIVALQAELSKV